MSLYRKYRPADFDELIGQEAVSDVLKKSIKSGNISHAYFFAGSRGTGKTSVARILAREIGTDSSDLYEIDAASNRGIDEIRELREAVRSLPFNSKYKVYIIDEVHMLTTPAFNALLKTLEEPPPHVIFILATTELDKIPDTIISRCQVYTFKRPTELDIVKLLERVVKKEGYKSDKGSLALAALLAEGSYRDALTILEKIINSTKDKTIEISEVEKVTGAPNAKLVEQFIGSFLSGDKSKALSVIADAVKHDVDMNVFAKLILRTARGALFIVFAPDLAEKIKSEVSDGEYAFLESLTKSDNSKKLPNLLRALLRAEKDMNYAYIKSLPLELAVVEGLL